MRRADRLFQLVQLIRGRRLTTAAFLAQRLEVSERTVYRDVADLQHQGVPIEGEAGVGYRLGAGFELPPLMFTQEEASALVAAARLAQSWVDPALARNIETGLGKILSVLPPAARVSAEALALYAPALGLEDAMRARLQVLREAVETHHKLRLSYRDVSGDAILELGERLQEGQLAGARRAVALLADDDLGDAGLLGVLVVVVVAVDEHDDVGVLLDGAGFAQVAHHGALVGALLDAARQLRQRDHRAAQSLASIFRPREISPTAVARFSSFMPVDTLISWR
jgi:biotin operon repressor